MPATKLKIVGIRTKANRRIMKRLKENRQKPEDYQLLLRLSDIQHWKKLERTIAEMEISCYGFYCCIYDDKKILVIK